MANCLYNGTILPALPKNAYPYSAVHFNRLSDTEYNAELVCSTCALTYSDGFISTSLIASEDGTLIVYTANQAVTEWKQGTDGEKNFTAGESVYSFALGDLKWSNYDILNEDGTLYLAASEPVPVLAPTIEPLSMWQGWKAGNLVLRQRGKIQKWETLFEGEVESRESVDIDPNEYLGAAFISMSYPGFAYGDRIRLTVNGESQTFTAIYKNKEPNDNQKDIVYVGNSDVGGGVSNGFENENVIDYDYCLLQYDVYEGSIYLPANASSYLYTRSAGMYSVKVEKAVI